MPVILSSEIAKLRLISQQLVASSCYSAGSLIDYMTAMQAQDFAASKWAVGMRIPDCTLPMVDEAIVRGDLLRMHLLRPTWHWASGKDIRQWIRLCAKSIINSARTREISNGLTDDIIAQCKQIIHHALSENPVLSKAALMEEIEKHGIATKEDNMAAHILIHAEMGELVCSGGGEGNKQTYTLLSNRAQDLLHFDAEKSAALLAEKYFISHGPATFDDFLWWSALPVKLARSSVESLGQNIIRVTCCEKVYWMAAKNLHASMPENQAHFLPAFDEYIISYRHREDVLLKADYRKIISSNGIFRPALLINGIVAGLWRRTTLKGRFQIDIEPFRSFTPAENVLITEAAEQYAKFLDARVELV
jgi:hypothetical protein